MKVIRMYVPVYMCVFKFFSEITGPMKPKFMWNQARKVNSTDSGSFVVLHYFQPREGGGF